MNALIIVCLSSMLIFGVMSVMLRSTIKSAISLAMASVSLGMLMFEFHSTWAALFELSVCSGLVTIIFISAISMTNESKDDQDKLYNQKRHMALLPATLIILGVMLISFMYLSGFALPTPAMTSAEESFAQTMWVDRQGDILAQMIVLLTGAFAIVVLFREDIKR